MVSTEEGGAMQAALSRQLHADMDDATLLTLSADIPEAFAMLVERHQAFVFGAAFRVTRNPVSAEDIAQEAFLTAYRRRETYRGEGSVRGWLYRIARNLALNAVTRSREVPTETMEDAPIYGTPEWEVLREVDIARVRTAMNRLPEAIRVALFLREFEDAPYDEIADRLGIPVNTVRSRIHRGRKALEGLLREEDGT